MLRAKRSPTKKRWQAAQYHEFNFWRYTHYRGYQNLSWEELCQKQENELLSLAAQIKPLPEFVDDTVIDLGCGPIGLPCYLQCRRAIGIDPLMVAYRREFAHLRSTPPSICWISSQGEEVPLADGIADVIFSRNVLDHVQYPEIWLKEFVRLLRPGGKFILYVNLSSGRPKWGDDALLHPHTFTEKSVVALLRQFPLQFTYYVGHINSRIKLWQEAPIIVTGSRLEEAVHEIHP